MLVDPFPLCIVCCGLSTRMWTFFHWPPIEALFWKTSHWFVTVVTSPVPSPLTRHWFVTVVSSPVLTIVAWGQVHTTDSTLPPASFYALLPNWYHWRTFFWRYSISFLLVHIPSLVFVLPFEPLFTPAVLCPFVSYLPVFLEPVVNKFLTALTELPLMQWFARSLFHLIRN